MWQNLNAVDKNYKLKIDFGKSYNERMIDKPVTEAGDWKFEKKKVHNSHDSLSLQCVVCTWPCRTPVRGNCPGWGSGGSCAGHRGVANPAHYSWSHQPHVLEPPGTPQAPASLQPISATPSLTAQRWGWAHDAPPVIGNRQSRRSSIFLNWIILGVSLYVINYRTPKY